MKLLTFFLFIPLAVWAQESCVEKVDSLCSKTEDFFDEFKAVKLEAFENASKKAPMHNLICQNFERDGDGGLVADFSWVRSCWFYRFNTIFKKNDIKECSDFKRFGADSFFINNCEDLVSFEMQRPKLFDAHYIAEKQIQKIKDSFELALRDRVDGYKLKSALAAILPKIPLAVGLTALESTFVKASDLCQEFPKEDLCKLYKFSDRYALILGGNLFLSPKVKRALISKKIAEFISDRLHDSLYEERLGVYFEFFSKMPNNSFESIVARTMTEDPLNKSTNTTLILSKLYELEGEINETDLSFYCKEEVEQVDDEFDKIIKSLSPQDKMKVLACPVERVIGL